MSFAAAAPLADLDMRRNGSSFEVKLAPKSIVDIYLGITEVVGYGRLGSEDAVLLLIAARVDTIAGWRCLALLKTEGNGCHFQTSLKFTVIACFALPCGQSCGTV